MPGCPEEEGKRNLHDARNMALDLGLDIWIVRRVIRVSCPGRVDTNDHMQFFIWTAENFKQMSDSRFVRVKSGSSLSVTCKSPMRQGYMLFSYTPYILRTCSRTGLQEHSRCREHNRDG